MFTVGSMNSVNTDSGKMKNYRYSLEEYTGMNSRHDCPSCGKKKTFTLYIDAKTNEPLNKLVGRCNREDKCGYHLTPEQYFETTGITPETDWTPQRKKEPEPIIFIDPEMMRLSLAGYDNNNLAKFLASKFGTKTASELISKYLIGTSKVWSGANIFYQIDAAGSIRRGKIMLYDPETGRRDKHKFNTVHALQKQSKNNPPECFFGEHLTNGNNKPVCIVESEKTALIASVYYPESLWLACGGLSMLNYEKCKALKGKSVTLYPDLNGFEKWKEKADLFLPDMVKSYTVSNLLETIATDTEKENGLDIADYLLRYNVADFTAETTTQGNDRTETDTIPVNPKEQLKTLLNELIEKVPMNERFAINGHEGECFNKYVGTALNNLNNDFHNPNTRVQIANIYQLMELNSHTQFNNKY